jgi:hypothetical protein
LRRFFWLIYIFFNLLYRWTLFLKIKINLFLNNIFNMCNLALFFCFSFIHNLICMSIFIIVWLNKKIIWINKFSKYNRVNITSCEIKYIDLHHLLYRWTLFLKIKENLFSNNISNMCSLAYYFFSFILFYSINLMCVSIFIIIWLNKKINKFSKHNRVNITSCEIKYLDIYLSLDFFNFYF